MVRYGVFRMEWLVNVKDNRKHDSWEISVVRADNAHGLKSYGWFDEDKLLVSHNGGPCKWPICDFVWEQQLKIAQELCARLNAGATPSF